MQQKKPAPKLAPKPAPKPKVEFLDEAVKDGIVARIAGMDADARKELMMGFKDAFDIKCSGAPNRDFIQLPGHGEWLLQKLDATVG